MIAIIASMLGIGGISGLALWFIGPKAIFEFLKSIPGWVWIAIGVVAALLLLWHIHSGWEDQVRKDAFNQGFNVEWRHHQADLKAIKAAQKKAETDQKFINARPGIVSGQIAGESNANAQIYYQRGRDAGAAYADAHRASPDPVIVRNPSEPGSTDDRSPSSQANLSRPDQALPGNDGPGDTSELVTLSRPDFDLLVGNSLRLARVHEDVVSLILAGVVVPLDDKLPPPVSPPE